MDPHDEADDIPLPLRGKTVSRCIIDAALGIDFIEGGERSTIRIERRFMIRALGAEEPVSIGYVEDLGSALVLLGKTVTKALARGDGALGVTFDDGTVLYVPPDPSAEAWEFAGPDRSVVASLPGGGLYSWARVERANARGKP